MSALNPVGGWRSARPPVRPHPGWQIALLLLAALPVFLGTLIGMGKYLGIAALLALLALPIWRWPLLGLLALVILGPPHQTLMVLTLHLTHSTTILKAAQLWKDALVLLLLAKAVSATFARRRAPTVHLLDLGLLIFLAYGLLYLAFPSQLQESSLMSRALGLRVDAFFLVPYFIGRGIPLDRGQVRTILLAFAVTSFVIAAVAAAQFAAPGFTNNVFDNLGLKEFTEVKFSADRAAGAFAVRENFIGGLQLPRASSLLLSDLGLAFYSLLTVPLAAALLVSFQRLRWRVMNSLLLLAVVGATLMTMTRSAMLAIVPALAITLARGRAPIYGLLIAVQIMVIALPIAYTHHITPSTLQAMFSPGEASAQGHARALQESLSLVEALPFGQGLGTAGQVSQAYESGEGITTEDWYLQIATEIGVIAAVIFALCVLGVGVVAFRQYDRLNDPWLRALCLGLVGATVGYGIVGLTLNVWDSETTSLLFWLFAGIAVQASDLATAGRDRR